VLSTSFASSRPSIRNLRGDPSNPPPADTQGSGHRHRTQPQERSNVAPA
jgi:hypothetical protein